MNDSKISVFWSNRFWFWKCPAKHTWLWHLKSYARRSGGVSAEQLKRNGIFGALAFKGFPPRKKWSSLCIYLYNTCNTVTPWLYMYTTYCVNMESPYSKCTFGHVECISLKASGMTSCEMRSKCLVNATEDAISTLESSHFSMFFRMCPVCSW